MTSSNFNKRKDSITDNQGKAIVGSLNRALGNVSSVLRIGMDQRAAGGETALSSTQVTGGIFANSNQQSPLAQ